MNIESFLSIIRPNKLKITIFAGLWTIVVLAGISTWSVCYPVTGIACGVIFYLFAINIFLFPNLAVTLLWLFLLYITSSLIVYLFNKRYGQKGNVFLYRFLFVVAGLYVYSLGVLDLFYTLFATLFIIVGLSPQLEMAFRKPRKYFITLIAVLIIVLALFSIFYIL